MKKLLDLYSEFPLFASFYSILGLNLTRISDRPNNPNEVPFKSPDHEWNKFKFFTQKRSEVERMFYSNGGYYGLGAVLGFRNIRVIDIDGCNDEDLIQRFCETLGLPKNYSWVVKTGSRNGFHIYVRCVQHEFSCPYGIPKAFKSKGEFNFKTIELIWQGHSVLPPSIHKNEEEKLKNKNYIDSNLDLVDDNLDIEYFYSFLNGRPNDLPAVISVDLLNTLISNYCENDLINGPSEVSLDYGTKLVSKNSSLIFDSLNFLSPGAMYLFFDLKFESPSLEGSEYITPDEGFVKFSKFLTKQLLVQGAWRLVKRGGELLETCSYFTSNDSEYSAVYGTQDFDYPEEKLAVDFGISVTEFLVLVQNRINISDFFVFYDQNSFEGLKNEFIKYGFFLKKIDSEKVFYINDITDENLEKSQYLKNIFNVYDISKVSSNELLKSFSSDFWIHYTEFGN